MVETIVSELTAFFQDKIPEELIAFVISLCPVLECRGGMIAARLMEIPFIKAFLICYLGNMLPIPFIILFIRKIFDFLRRFKFFSKIVEKLEAKTEKNKEKVLKYEAWGLLLFVAIPLPGTGAWTGAALAGLMNMRLKTSVPSIFFGVITAGIIMTLVSHGIFNVLFGL